MGNLGEPLTNSPKVSIRPQPPVLFPSLLSYGAFPVPTDTKQSMLLPGQSLCACNRAVHVTCEPKHVVTLRKHHHKSKWGCPSFIHNRRTLHCDVKFSMQSDLKKLIIKNQSATSWALKGTDAPCHSLTSREQMFHAKAWLQGNTCFVRKLGFKGTITSCKSLASKEQMLCTDVWLPKEDPFVPKLDSEKMKCFVLRILYSGFDHNASRANRIDTQSHDRYSRCPSGVI